MKKIILIAAMAAICATASQAQRGQRLSRDCRREVMQLCRGSGARDAIRTCLVRERSQISQECLKEITARKGGAVGSFVQAKGGTEYNYGPDAKQRFDFWAGSTPKAPLVIFIHGGGWAIGDKSHDRSDKAGYYHELGYAYASVNYRLVPNAKPDEQAADIAQAIAKMRRDAAALGIDADRIILMGHSAGAHLAALVSSDPRYLSASSVPMTAIKGTILLDGAGYDVPAQMAYKGNQVSGLYDKAFGADPAYQKAVSPITHVASPNVGNWLLLYVASRKDSQAQSTGLAKALSQSGANTRVAAVPDSTHMTVNRDAGIAGSFVATQIEAFVKSALQR